MANLNKINELLEEKNVKKITFYKEISFTSQGLGKAISNNKIMTDVLERIANYFKVPIGYFFDECEATGIGVMQNGNNNYHVGNGKISIGEQKCLNDLDKCREKLKSLEEQLKLKDELLKGKDEVIRLLKK